MSTSGSTDFSLTAREAIDFSLKKLRAIDGETGTATAGQASGAQRELNLMLKEWQRYQSLWRLTEGSVTLVAGQSAYTLSPQPHRVVSVRYLRAGGSSIPIELLSREEYYDFPSSATSTGSPHSFYIDYQRASTILHIQQPLSAITTETLTYTYQRKFEDIDSLDDDIDVRSEWLGCVGYNLAARLGIDFGRVGGPGFAEIKEQALIQLEMLQDDDTEDIIRMVPAYG